VLLNETFSYRSPRNWSKSRTLSVSFPGGTLSPGGFGGEGGLAENRSSLSGIPEEVTLDYTQVSFSDFFIGRPFANLFVI